MATHKKGSLVLDDENVVRWVGKTMAKLKNPTPFLQETGAYMTSSIQKRIEKGVAPKNAPLTKKMKKGDNTLRDNGIYMNSINYELKGNSAVLVGSPQIQSRILHKGGVILPKRAQKLAVPAYEKMWKEQKRLSPRDFLNKLKSQGWRIWFKEKAIMGTPPGKRTKPVVLYIRKESVKIPARPHYYVSDGDAEVIDKIFGDYLKMEKS